MDRALWIHLVSHHADPLALVRLGSENEAQHERMHNGPGRRVLHSVSDMSFNLDTVKTVLADYVLDLSV